MTDWQMIKMAISIILVFFGMIVSAEWMFAGMFVLLMTATSDKKRVPHKHVGER